MTNKNNTKIHPVGAAVVGAMAGAAGAALALTLSDEKNREKIKQKVKEFSDKAVELRDSALEAKDAFKGKTEEAHKEVKKLAKNGLRNNHTAKGKIRTT